MSIKNKKVSLPNMSNNLVIPKIRKELSSHPLKKDFCKFKFLSGCYII